MNSAFVPSRRLLPFLRSQCHTDGTVVVLSRLKPNQHATDVWDHSGPEVWIQWIESSAKGAGAHALHKLVKAADATGTLLRLSLDDDGSGKLEAFYKRFGFVRDSVGGDICERSPMPLPNHEIKPFQDLFNDRLSPDGAFIRDNFAAWFGESKVIDAAGLPKVMFHGTDADFHSFEWTEDIGFHFGSIETANARVVQAEMESSLIIPVYLTLKNPLRICDLHTWSPSAVTNALVDLGVITQDQADQASAVDREQTSVWLEAKGFDGLVYSNVTEGGGDSYIALHPTQIKSAIGNSGSFDPKSTQITDSVLQTLFRALSAIEWIEKTVDRPVSQSGPSPC